MSVAIPTTLSPELILVRKRTMRELGDKIVGEALFQAIYGLTMGRL